MEIIWPQKGTEDYKAILDTSLDVFHSYSFLAGEKFIRDARKYVFSEENEKDQCRLISMILDVAKIKKLSPEQASDLVKKSSEIYMWEMIGRYIYMTNYSVENPKATSPFKDICFVVEEKLIKQEQL